MKWDFFRIFAAENESTETMQQYYDKLIAKLPKFDNEEFYEVLDRCTEIEVVEKGHQLINFQSLSKKLFVIIEGAVMTDFIARNAEKRTIMFHTEEFCPFFKSYDSFFLHKHSSYEVRAVERTVVGVINFEHFYQYVLSDLEVLQFYTHATEELFMITEQLRNNQLTLTSEEYLEWLYDHFPFIMGRFPAQNIASFMGITPVWLSKLKAKLFS